MSSFKQCLIHGKLGNESLLPLPSLSLLSMIFTTTLLGSPSTLRKETEEPGPRSHSQCNKQSPEPGLSDHEGGTFMCTTQHAALPTSPSALPTSPSAPSRQHRVRDPHTR